MPDGAGFVRQGAANNWRRCDVAMLQGKGNRRATVRLNGGNGMMHGAALVHQTILLQKDGAEKMILPTGAEKRGEMGYSDLLKGRCADY